MPQPYHTAGGGGSTPTPPAIGVQEAGWGIYSTLNRKKKALSSEGNSRQILPSTTDTESGFTVKGTKVTRSADSKRLIFICTFPASFNPMV
jgi:hypothetical protein